MKKLITMTRKAKNLKPLLMLLLLCVVGMNKGYAYSFSQVIGGNTLYFNITGGAYSVEITYPGTASNPWGGYTKPTGNLSLPESVYYNGMVYYVFGIGERAFYECSGLTGSLAIPNFAYTIGDYAFYGCSGFTGSLTIGASVTSIGDYAFSGCNGFTGSLTMVNVATIGDAAFFGCSSFTGSLVIPNSVTLIGNSAFRNCTSFTGSLVIPNSEIGISAFRNCTGFTGSLTIGNSVTTIDDYAFYGCSGFTGSLTIGNSLTTIGNYAFSGCSGFTGSPTIPNSVTSIGNYAFYGCSGFTGSLTIPKSVTSIGTYAFYGCSGFTGSLIIGSSVTTIDDVAFGNCSGFTSMVVKREIPPTLGTNAMTVFYIVPKSIPVYVPCASLSAYQTASGWSAFTNYQCLSYDFSAVCSTGQTLYYNITDATNQYVEITSPNASYPYWDEDAEPTGNITLPSYVTFNGITYEVKGIGNNAFYSCDGLTGPLTIPNSVTSIGSWAFGHCTGFTGSLTISNSVTSIGQYAFYACSGFDGELTIGNSVTSIGQSAFWSCSGFTSMKVRPLTPPTLGTNAFPNALTTIPVYVPCASLEDYQSASGWSSFGNFQCSEYDFSAVCSTGQTLYYTITDVANHYVMITYPGISTSGPWVGYTQPTGNITLPSNVTYNGVTYTVTAIDDFTFAYCTGLTGSLIIPNTVTTIGDYAFWFCTGFTGSLVLPNSLTTIGQYAFDYCPNFTGDLTIPNSVTTIGDGAFLLCSGFNGTLTIGSSVTTIGYEALGGLSNLSSMVVLPETPPTLGTDALSGIPTNIPVYVPCVSLENYQTAPGWSAFSNYMQCFETETVYEGTTTSYYVPAYIAYFDAYTRSQFVIPAADLADMAGSSISSMTFYTTSSNVPYVTTCSADVYLKEVNYTTINAFESKASADIVYSGTFSIVSTDSGGEMTIHFSTPYTYNGGNLMVGIENTAKGGWKEISFYGQPVSGASISSYNSTSLANVAPTQRNFIPKTTFGYTPSECSRPIDLSETDITINSAVLQWTGYQEEYDLRYRKKPVFFEDFENGLPSNWTTIDNDGDGYNWHSASNYSSYYCHSGRTIMVSASYDNDNGIILTPDNWLITPQIELQGTMKVWLRALLPNYAQEHFAIYLSTTSNSVSDFTTVLVPETTLTDAQYRAYTADLSAYAGQQGYIAIRHFNCSDMYEILLDDFGLFNDPDETGEWEEWTYFGPNSTLNELEPATEYEWQVRGQDCDGYGTFTDWSSAHSFNTLLCSPEDQCELTFTLTDGWGDGWNGAAIRVMDVATNILLASMSAPSHDLNNTSTTDNITLSVCDGRELRFEWVSGIYDFECSYNVTDSHGNDIFSGAGAMSAPVTYIVNCSGQYFFLTDGNWNDGSHWNTGSVPPASSDVVIQANATVPAGYLAEANEVTLDGGSITVADGGQLKHNTLDLVVTMKKNIIPYTNANGLGNYYLLAFPFLSVQVPTAMTSASGSDFYRFDPSESGAEWRNHKQEPITFVQRRYGYLYANPEPVELSLTGTTLSVSNEFTMSYTVDYTEGSGNPSNGWELLGNPFTHNAYVYRFGSNNEFVPMPIMMYDEEGVLQTIYGGPVAPMQGFFVHVTETTTVYFSGTALHEDDYVDLGLPSGTLWATFNIGANAPEGYGDYFAWGETAPKDTYSWNTYQYCNGSYNTITKYCDYSSCGYNGFTDYLYTLLPEDDAATTNWGGKWRMPTKEEWQELINNTTSTWTTQNGMNGRLFTAANGNSLFLPAAGYHNLDFLAVEGIQGQYWSSSLQENSTGAWDIHFHSGYTGMNYDGRCQGQSVRAVRSGVPAGAIEGKFSVNADGDQVCFSQGNLQYIGSASTPYWKFADHQWDILGNNGQSGTSQNVDRDLFGWGTSGYNHGAVCYQPWNTELPYDGYNYDAYGNSSYDLFDQTGQADWGYNAIINGGNTENRGWRTLTHTEWDYVFNTRTTPSGMRYVKAMVNDVEGVILFPDNWKASYCNLNNINTGDTSFDSNAISASEWSGLEMLGAVFLPAAGDRAGNSMGYYRCCYWASTHYQDYWAYYLSFYNTSFNTNAIVSRHFGQSVRLVYDVK